MLGLVKQINSILAVILNRLPTVPDPIWRGGGLRGTCPPPPLPEEAMSALKNTQKQTFFHVLLKEKGGGGTDRAVIRLANDGILNPL